MRLRRETYQHRDRNSRYLQSNLIAADFMSTAIAPSQRDDRNALLKMNRMACWWRTNTHFSTKCVEPGPTENH
jgi:hypothetical protein